MLGRFVCTLSTFLALIAFGLSSGHARDLTFADRIAAQEAIERVYYSHQDGATTPFEEALPRAVLERKVTKYLKQSVALEQLWHTPVTAEMLERELQRMIRDTRAPDRLRQLFAALDDDPLLIQECLARATLVDRLSRNFYAFDGRLHARERREANALREALTNGVLDPLSEHPRRRDVELIRESDDAGSGHRSRLELSDSELEDWRDRLPDAPGDIGPIDEDRTALHVRVLLEGDDARLRFAAYRVEKTTWDRWWKTVSPKLDGSSVVTVAAPGASLAPAVGSTTGEFLGVECAGDDTWDNASLDDLPVARSRHTAVWTGSEMLVWGGKFDIAYNTGGRYDPATDTWTSISTVDAPAPRFWHTAVWTGSEMLVWGGRNDIPYDTGGRYDPATDTWTSISTADAPSPRAEHTAVWTGSVMLVWGGYEIGAVYPNTGGRYDPATDTWTSTSTVDAPSPRAWHTAIWTGSLMLVWGGAGQDYIYDTGGRYDPATDSWTPTSTVGAPSERELHTAVWTGNLMIVWGGDGTSDVNTGGRYDPTTDTWTTTTTTGAPAPRFLHTAVWTGNSMVVWGGFTWSGEFGDNLDSGGRYDPGNDTWTATSTAGAPSPRFLHAAVWTGDLMLTWGGGLCDSHSCRELNTGGRYDPEHDTWTPTSIAGAPSQRSEHTAVWTGSLMLVWGGYEIVEGYLNTGGRYDPATDSWTVTSIVGAPSPRNRHTPVWTGGLMVIWGGEDDAGPLDTGGTYNPVTDTWAATSTVNAPTPRRYHTAVWTGSRMVVWGGYGFGYLKTGGLYDPATDSWTATSMIDAPLRRGLHTAVWADSVMVVWGGEDGSPGGDLYTDTGGRYDPATDSWTTTSTVDAPSPRAWHTTVWTGDRMVVWGGEYGGNGRNTGGRYDPATDSWTTTTTSGAPSPRYGHTGVWTGSRLLVWGGYADGYVNTGGQYDPVSDHWEPAMSIAGAPAPRFFHTAVWTGSHVLVWGGRDDVELNNGGRYALGHSSDDDADGLAECDGDCNDQNPTIYPGAPEICDGFDNQCPGDPDHGQVDVGCNDDGDGYCDAGMAVAGPPVACPHGGGDCDDADPSVYPDAPEVNDGLDNQCPGDLGHGVVDETSGNSGFHNAGDEDEYSWEAQAGATAYEVVRSSQPDFSSGCSFLTTTGTAITTDAPPAGIVHFYLNRPIAPFVGSWGQDSSGQEREPACAGEE